MRKIIYWMSVSVDGYMEGPNREIDWHLVDEEWHSFVNQQLRTMSAFLSGRVTHELMADYWPTADADPAAPAPIAEFAAIWREMPKVVYSRTLETAEWNTVVMREVDSAEVGNLKEQAGGDMVVGGADLAATFRDLGLVDEFTIFIHPIVLGAGKPMFRPADTRTPLGLIETRVFGNGVVMLRYGRDSAASEADSP